MKTSANIGLNIPEGNDVFDYKKFLADNLSKIDENIVKIPTSEEFTATEGQTVFNLASSYTVGENVLSVEVDGVPQDLGEGFLETSETSITLTEGVPAGAIVSVTTFNLPKGVNTQLADINSQLADIAYNPKNSGAKLNGIDDDWSFLQTFTDSLAAGTQVIFPPNSVFNITKPWMIRKGIKLNFNGSKLRYVGTGNLGTTNGVDRYYGAITIEGSLDNTKQLSITSLTPNYYDPVAYQTLFTAKVSTGVADASTTFAIGDIVYLDAKNYATWLSWAQDYSDNPALVRCPAKIVNITGGDIFVDINPDFVFGGVNFNGTITKVNTVNDVVIENLYYEDATNGTIPATPTNAQRETWVGGIHSYYTSNLRIENFESKRHRFPALKIDRAYNTSLNNVRGYEAQAISAGCGYLIQNNASSHSTIEKLRGHKVRHLCDFSGGGHHVVSDARQSANLGTLQFDCHGLGEFDVTFRDCIGDFHLGNGLGEFPVMVAGVNLDNVKGSITIDWIKDLNVRNSKLTFLETRRTNRVVSMKVLNSEILGTEKILGFFANSRGGAYNDSVFTLEGCEITENNLTQIASGDFFTLTGYEIVRISRNRLNNKHINNTTISILKCKYTYINDNLLRNVGFKLQDTSSEIPNTMTMDKGFLQFKGNAIEETNGNTGSFSFLNMNSGTGLTKFKVTISENEYNALGASRWIRFGTNTTFTGDIFLTVTGNTFLANIVELVPTIATLKVKVANNNIEGYTGTTITA